MTEARPPYRHPGLLALVFLGGAAGTTARWGTGVVVPHVLRVPLGTLVVNVLGALVLGALLAHLDGRGPDEGRRRAWRLVVGTGFCGGFTTYSALANDTAALLRQGQVGHALGYVGATLVLGLGASALGVALARWAGRRGSAP